MAYLYRTVDKFGNTIDFYLSPTRNTTAAKRFLGKALKGLKHWELPHVVSMDKAPTYAVALAELNFDRHRHIGMTRSPVARTAHCLTRAV